MAIKQHFNVDFSSKEVYLPVGYAYINNKLIKYEREENNIYVGDSFYVKDGVVTELNKDYQEMIDHAFILDKKNGTITDICGIDDSLVEVLQNEITGKKISVSKDKETDTTMILADGQELCTLQSGKITRLNLLETTELPDNFLSKLRLKVLWELNALKLKRIGNHSFNDVFRFKMNLPELEEIGDRSFFNGSHYDLDMPKLKKVGSATLNYWSPPKDYRFDCLEEVGDSSLTYIKTYSFPCLKKVGNRFCQSSLEYEENLYVPELEEVGNSCFCNAGEVENLDFPKLRIAGHNFLKGLAQKKGGRRVNLPSLECVGKNFMDGSAGYGVYDSDYSLAEFNAPKLKTVGNNFMERCTDIEQKNMPDEINVRIEFYEEETKSFMAKMPAEKRPKPVALEPEFTMVFEPKSAQENHTERGTPMSEPAIGNAVQIPAVEPNTLSSDSQQRPMGLRDRLYAASEQGRMAKALSFVRGLFSKRNR